MSIAFLSVLVLMTLSGLVMAAPSAPVPCFPLNNTAVPGVCIPAIGVGTGAYKYCPNGGYGGWPECMDEAAGCGEYTERTVISWLTLGGRRLDCANAYGNTKAVGRAILASSIPRSEIFITEKVGPPPSVSLGYNDTLIQVTELLRDLQTPYIDLLLIHEPVNDIPQSMDPYCREGSPVYTESACRVSTWKAMLKVFNDGQALAVGVSNWNITHLQDLVDAGLPLPSVNQCPFNYYHSSVQQELIDFCRANGILFHGYSAFGAPDVFVYPINGTGMSFIQLEDPTLKKIASAHDVTVPQVLLQWQYSVGIPNNARSQNPQHMIDNLNSYSFTLTADEIKVLNSGPQAMTYMNNPFPKPGQKIKSIHREVAIDIGPYRTSDDE